MILPYDANLARMEFSERTGKMVHKFSARADEQRKEAEVVRLRTPPRKIWIDLMTGQICDPEPIEHGGQVIPFTAPRSGLRGKNK